MCLSLPTVSPSCSTMSTSASSSSTRNDMIENNLEEDILVAKNSMPEDDPNGNTLHDAREIRWGPQHAGAKLLASQYTKGKKKPFKFKAKTHDN